MQSKGKTVKVVAVAAKKKPLKEVKVEYLYLDLNTCDRCVGTDAVLEQVIKELTPAFTLAGYRISYQKIEIANDRDAVNHRFVSSPTIRVNGMDICDEVKESDCGCCGEISGTQVDCRVFEYEGKTDTVPPKAMLAEAILQKAFHTADKKAPQTFEIPDDLDRFFKGKEKKKSCCGGSSCC